MRKHKYWDSSSTICRNCHQTYEDHAAPWKCFFASATYVPLTLRELAAPALQGLREELYSRKDKVRDIVDPDTWNVLSGSHPLEGE